MIEWVIAAAVTAAAGAGVFGLSRRKKGHSDWSELLEDVALRLEGRASPAGRFDTPELRAQVDGTQVTLRLSSALNDETEVDATADAQLRGQPGHRIYFGWNVDAPPTDWVHVPEVATGALRLEGHWKLLSDDAELAQHFVQAAEIPLADLSRESEARAIAVSARGGYIHVVVNGCRQTSTMLERVVRVTAELAGLLADPHN